MKAHEKLIKISSDPICRSKPDHKRLIESFNGPTENIESLVQMLSTRNGFFAFESALLIFPSMSCGVIPGIIEWNSLIGWRRYYEQVSSQVMYFGEDLFAGQFGMTPTDIIRLEPETGEVQIHSKSLEEWAQKILDNYDYETGWSLAKEWQEQNGPLPYGSRLLGKRPFVLGGDYSTENLVAIPTVEAMEKLGNLSQQIKDVPDGNQITIRGWLT